MSRFVTVHSDGTGRGTVILDEDGKQIAGVTELNFSIEADGVTHGSIEVRGVHANVSGVAIEEVNFSCPLCGDVTEHKCDTQLGGGSPTIQHASLQFSPSGFATLPTHNPIHAISWIPCGKTSKSGMADLTCIVNEDIHHTSHFDAEYGISWSGL